MIAFAAMTSAAAGTALVSRTVCHPSRFLGAGLLTVALALAAMPARADQTIMASDSAQVDCLASAKDLTRVSLVEDGFASVSKITTGSPQDDFSVVNEPVRGDIYLSVPEGFGRASLSFFATSKRGYVYKFICRIAGDAAAQVFVSNPAIAGEASGESSRADAAAPEDMAIDLVQAMYANAVADGYEMRQREMGAVYLGTLKAQMIAEYRGASLTGRVLRIENRGKAPIELTSTMVAPPSALAVAIAETRLEPRQATTAYLVSRTGLAPQDHASGPEGR